MCLGYQQNDSDRLKIKAFYIRLSLSNTRKPLPDSLTLYFLPRINASPLYINESEIRPDSPGFVTLHRSLSGERDSKAAVFGSRERVTASEGVRFEVYLRDDKVLRGIFRRDDESDEWRLECKCVLEREIVGVEVKEAEVCVAAEGREVMREKVEVAVMRRKGGNKYYCFQGLEEIPEGREVESESDGCCCSCSNEMGSDGGDCEEESGEDIVGMEIEGVRWAVDVGIWVMCLGVGYLVSKASSKSLMRHGRLM